MPTNVLNYRELEAVHDHAILAEDVYNNSPDMMMPIAGGWVRILDSDEIPGLGDSGFYGAVYMRNINGKSETTIAFRGMNDSHDLDDAFAIATGRSPGQVRDAYNFSRMAIEGLGLKPEDVKFTGHSLGGYLSKAVGLMMGAEKIYAFNSPGLFEEDFKRLPRKIESQFRENAHDLSASIVLDNVISVNSRWDPVARVGPHQGLVIKLNTNDQHHSMSNLRETFTIEVMNQRNQSAQGTAPHITQEMQVALPALS